LSNDIASKQARTIRKKVPLPLGEAARAKRKRNSPQPQEGR